jgi:hypothetical protein
MEKRVKVAAVLLSVVFVMGIIIWSCMYFIIYYPLLHRIWKDANCTITEIRNFTMIYVLVTEFSVYAAEVTSNNTRIGVGYGCSSTSYQATLSLEIASGGYPYKYLDCSSPGITVVSCYEDELLQPSWLCFDPEDKYLRQIGNSVECKYYINGDESAESYAYPQSGEDFIEVLYQDEVYIPMADYIALWVCVFGLMCVLPCLLCFLGLPIPLGWCSLAERLKYKDFYHRFICCRKKQVPRCIEACGDLQAQITLAPCIIWLYTVKSRPGLFPMKTVLIREVCDYLASE